MLSDAIQTNWSVNLLEQNLHSSTPSFKLDWPFRCLVISFMFTCQSFKEAHKILLCGFGLQLGSLTKTGPKTTYFVPFFHCHLCGRSKKRGRDTLIHRFSWRTHKFGLLGVGIRYRYPTCGSNSQTSISLQADSSIPDICHKPHEHVRVNFFWPV